MRFSTALCLCTTVFVTPLRADHHEGHADAGFVSIFDGKDLKASGWSGIDKFWSVEDGAITGQTTVSNPTRGNTFCIWRQGEVDDFELKLQYKIVGGNSGIQYRSQEERTYVIAGYQADFEAGTTWSGTNYHERGRGVLAKRSERTIVFDKGKERKVVGSLGNTAELQKTIRNEDWNDYHIIARGRRFIHKINGVVMSDVTDRGMLDYRDRGVLAVQLHAGPPMKVQFRNIRLKRLRLEDRKKVVVVAGRKSHGKGSHEFYGGGQLLVNALKENMRNMDAVLYAGGWPDDPTAFDNADAIVIYSDGHKSHPVHGHLEQLDAIMKRGVGLACIHYAVEIQKGDLGGDYFLDWLGGFFELDWSVNPHWVAKYKSLPKHPITRGVQPFELDDEWYFHMRFRENMAGVTPILTAVPPKSTMDRKDGGRSGNPTVRAKVARGEAMHMAWATERPDGGRGFGFTGAHYHWSWGDDNFRTLVLNALVWISGTEVPTAGVPSTTPSRGDLRRMIGLPRKEPKS
jgi:hypothetical protein